MNDIVSVLSIVPDDTFLDASSVAEALKKAERLERIGVTLKLYIIARAIGAFGFDKTHEIVSSVFHHSEDYTGKLLAVASFVGADMLRNALEQGSELTFDQWRAIAESPPQHREGLYQLASRDDVNPIEIHASSQNVSIAEVKAKRVIEALWRLLGEADRLGLRDKVVDLLMDYGYLPKMIVSSKVSRRG